MFGVRTSGSKLLRDGCLHTHHVGTRYYMDTSLSTCEVEVELWATVERSMSCTAVLELHCKQHVVQLNQQWLKLHGNAAYGECRRA